MGSHDTIRASVLEQVADISLSRVDSYRAGSMHEDDHEFNLLDELVEASDLLERSISCLKLAVETNNSRYNDVKEDDSCSINSVDNNVFNQEMNNCDRNSQCHRSNDKLMVGEVRVDLESEGELTPMDTYDNGQINEEEGADEAKEMIALQLSGCLYKRVHTLSLIIIEKLKDAKVQECLNLLQKLIPACNLWIDLTKKTNRADSVWAADITVLKSLPIIWALLGEVCREISKGRGFMTPAEISSETAYIVEKWKELSFTSLGCCKDVQKKDDLGSKFEWLYLRDVLNLNDNNHITGFLQFLIVTTRIPTPSRVSSPRDAACTIRKSMSWATQDTSSDEDTGKDEDEDIDTHKIEEEKRAPTPMPSAFISNDSLYDVHDEKLGILSLVCYCFAWSTIFYDLGQHNNASNSDSDGIARNKILLNLFPSDGMRKTEEYLAKLGLSTSSFNSNMGNGVISRLKDSSSLQIIRQLADSCNAYAQRLLSLIICDFDVSATSCDLQSTKYKSNNYENSNVSDLTIRKLLLADNFLNMALFLFRVTKDNLNVSTVLLNSSCLLRKFAKLISVRSLLQCHHDDLEKYCENAGINDDGVNGVERLFNRAISLCNEAHNNLGEKGEISNIKIFQGNNVSSRYLPKHLHLIWEGI